ncbi:hypothetical protein JZU54_03915, partial [bacterium]|nr:hypothetical protein [bacterium]
MLKLCVTCGAGLKLALPAWLAVSVQVPAASALRVLPETRQIPIVLLARVTANPELAVALSVAVLPTLMLGAGSKVILWLAGPLLKLALTLFAASILTVQVGPALALHAPLQPVNLLPLVGVAVSVTVAPVNSEFEQTPEFVPAVLT